MSYSFKLGVGLICALGIATWGTSATAAPAPLKDITITGTGIKGTRNCGGGKASVVGNKSRLTLKNCKTVTVDGNAHKLTLVGTAKLVVRGNKNVVKAGKVASISVMGNRNTVTYTKRPKRKTKVSNLGNGNKVRGK